MLQTIALQILYYFEAYYSYLHLIKKYTPLPPSNDKLTNFTSTIITQLDLIPIEHIYTFFSDSLQKFSFTWYYNRIYNVFEHRFQNQTEYRNIAKYTTPEGYPVDITLKHIYDFANALVHYSADDKDKDKDNDKDTPNNSASKKLRFPLHWQSLSGKQKKIIEKRLNTNPDTVLQFIADIEVRIAATKDKALIKKLRDKLRNEKYPNINWFDIRSILIPKVVQTTEVVDDLDPDGNPIIEPTSSKLDPNILHMVNELNIGIFKYCRMYAILYLNV